MKTILLIAHLIAIATGTGLSIGNYFNIRIASGEAGERRAVLNYLRGQISRFGDVVIAIIWLTGLGLWWVLPPAGAPNSWFIVKIGFVLLLTVCHGLARAAGGRLARTGDDTLYARLELFVSGVWLSALAAIILAVLAFEA